MALSDKRKNYNVILEVTVKNEIDRIAKENDRSSSNLINWILKKHIESGEDGE